jgi:hypothetical protein
MIRTTHPDEPVLSAIANEVVGRWRARGRPLVGALIQGSSARSGTVSPGSDIDLCVVVPTAPNPAWYEECRIGAVGVEVVPLDAAALADLDAVLASPALPFNLCEGVIVDDPAGLLRDLRARLTPQLCAARYRRLRATACYERASVANVTVHHALRDADLACAQFEVTRGLWHTLGLDSAIACRCPTNRRGFVYLWQDAIQWGHPELITLARQALGCADLTEQTVRSLADVAGLIKERYRQSILALVERGEIEPAAWPLLHAALWRSAGDVPNPDAQGRILAALGYDSLAAVRQCQEAAHALATGLWQVAQTLVDTP